MTLAKTGILVETMLDSGRSSEYDYGLQSLDGFSY